MSCCGVTIQAHRNADLRKTYGPRSRNYTFAGFSPLMQIRDGLTVLLSISLSATANGSVFSVVGDALVLTIKKADIVPLSAGNEDRVLSYDIVLSQGGLDDWFLGGDFVALALNSAPTEGDSDVVVELGGEVVDVTISGGNIGVGASVLLADLNQAVEDAEQSAEEAAEALAAVPALAESVGAAAGSTAGASAGAAAGTTAGSTAGTAAANVVVAGKANTSLNNVDAATGRSALSVPGRDGSDVVASSFRTALGLGDAATKNVGTTNTTVAQGDLPFTQTGTGTAARSLYAKGQDTLNLADFAGYDATGVTASTAALQAAINNAVSTKRTLLVPALLRLDGQVIINGPVSIVGLPQQSQITHVGNYNAFVIRSSDVVIANIYHDCALKTGGKNVLIDTNTGGNYERIRIQNTLSFYSPGEIADNGGTGTHTKVDLIGVYGRILKGNLVSFTRSFAFCHLNDCSADFIGGGAPANIPGFVFTGTTLPVGAGGLQIDSCHVLGDNNATYGSQHGFTFTDMAAIWVNKGNTADNIGGDGWRFTRCLAVRGVLTASLCQGSGVVFDGSSFVSLTVSVNGRRVATGNAGASGIKFAGTTNNAIQINIDYISDIIGNAIDVTAAQTGAINLKGGLVFNATGKAIVTVGNSSVQWADFIMGGNTGGNYTLTGNLQNLEGTFAAGNRTSVAGPGVG